jgi:V8-like Glu-specific endopeptidase
MIRNLIIYAALAVLSLAHSAQSQDLMGFDRGSFGSIVLSQTQSAGTDVQLELSIGNYENEPIINYSVGSVFAKIGKSVGRLDVLTDKGNFPCTAFIVSKKYILTNYHCSLGLLDNEQIGATRIDAVQFVAGYTQTGIDEGTKKYTVIPTPVETSKPLDYAVLEVIGDPSQEYGQLKLSSILPNGGDPFWIIGHPMGEGQRISREKCKANNPALSAGKLLHTCDTLPGNSGSPVIDAGLQQVVALHHAGSRKDSVNFAILMSEILENSKVLTAYKAPESLPTVNAEPTKTVEITPCDALYSAAAEAKACFAYEAYFKSCRDHSLAPIADGYIQEFCQVAEVAEVEEAPEKAVAMKSCSQLTPEGCNASFVCAEATVISGNKKIWRMAHLFKKWTVFLNEAKKRGLDCGVGETALQTAAIKTAFKNKSILRRKQLQYALKKLNYYKSTIDALYGPGTEKALTGYANAKGININNPERIFKSVLRQVAVPSSFKSAAVNLSKSTLVNNCKKNIISCNDKLLCFFATRNGKWQTQSLPYAKEAKKRGLTCGTN